MAETLTIGQVARQVGIGVETVRFYERRGLIESPPRGSSGYRLYEPEAIASLKFIRRAKELGFTLREIKQLLELKLDEDSTCEDVKQHAEAKIQDIDARLASLQQMRRALVDLTQACDGRGKMDGCPIIRCLDDNPGCKP